MNDHANNIIFLDMEGVLTSAKSEYALGEGVIDPSAAGLIQALCRTTDAKVVVTSTTLDRNENQVMDDLKRALDPDNIMNPGKIVDIDR